MSSTDKMRMESSSVIWRFVTWYQSPDPHSCYVVYLRPHQRVIVAAQSISCPRLPSPIAHPREATGPPHRTDGIPFPIVRWGNSTTLLIIFFYYGVTKRAGLPDGTNRDVLFSGSPACCGLDPLSTTHLVAVSQSSMLHW